MSININDYKKEYDLVSLAGIEIIDYSAEMYKKIADWVNANLGEYFNSNIYSNSTGTRVHLYCKNDKACIYAGQFGSNGKHYISCLTYTTSDTFGLYESLKPIDTIKLVIIGTPSAYIAGWKTNDGNYYMYMFSETIDDNVISGTMHSSAAMYYHNSYNGYFSDQNHQNRKSDKTIISDFILFGEIMNKVKLCQGNYIGCGSLYQLENNIYTNLCVSLLGNEFIALKLN